MLVQLGDFCDWDSVASYEVRREEDIVLIQKEIESSNNLLDAIDRNLPKKCRKIMLAGNHEARYERFKVNHGFEVAIRRMKDFGSWYEEYNLPKRGWEYFKNYGDVFNYKDLILFTHGWASSGSHAKKHLHMFHKNILYGHTHQWQVETGIGLDQKPIVSASIGTLSRFDLSYLVGKPPVNWVHMFATIEFMDEHSFTPHFIPIIEGRFIKDGRTYGS